MITKSIGILAKYEMVLGEWSLEFHFHYHHHNEKVRSTEAHDPDTKFKTKIPLETYKPISLL